MSWPRVADVKELRGDRPRAPKGKLLLFSLGDEFSLGDAGFFWQKGKKRASLLCQKALQ
jgi:hypothetical protein